MSVKKPNLRKAFKGAQVAKEMFSQAEIADKLDIASSTLSGKLTKGNPSLATLAEIAHVFDMSVSEFIALGE